MVTIECVVRGNVQRVGYRAYVETAATELSLVGYTRNNPDGSVMVVAQGTPDSLKTFVEYLHEGSVLSFVESVEVTWRDAGETYYEFSVLH